MFYSKSGSGPLTLWLISEDAIHKIRIVELNWMNWGLMQENNNITRTGDCKKMEGYSSPLCNKIIESLWTRPEKFHLQTLCILRHNTQRDSEGKAYPIFNGFVVSLHSIQSHVVFISLFGFSYYYHHNLWADLQTIQVTSNMPRRSAFFECIRENNILPLV